MSLFVFVKDTNTKRVKRIAVPCDLQVGMLGNPAELQLLGRLSVSTTIYEIKSLDVVNVDGNVTIADINVITAPAGSITVNAPSGARDGQLFIVKDMSGTSLVTPLVIASPNELIDGSSTVTMSSNYGSIVLARVSGKWRVLFSSSTNFLGSPVLAPLGLSGSLQRTTDGLSYLVQARGINISSGSGQVIITRPVFDWSTVDHATTDSATLLPGNYTTGTVFSVQSAVTITGVRFYWAGSFVNVKVALWSGSGDFAQLTSKTATGVVSGPGYYTVLFDIPYDVPRNLVNRWIAVSVYETGGSDYTVGDVTDLVPIPTLPFRGGHSLTWAAVTAYGAGDSTPNSGSGGERYPVEPVFA